MESTGWAHTESLIVTGLSLGTLHVLAGPDHLSALAALSVGNSWRAFALGFRWGLGHSTGLVVVAIIFISLKGNLDLKSIGRYCDCLVGIFMIVLGSYGVLDALKIYREKYNKRDNDLSSPKSTKSNNNYTSTSTSISTELDSNYSNNNKQYTSINITHNDDDHMHTIDFNEYTLLNCIDMRDPTIQRIVSFSIGLLHGVAGPGGILGVLPAVEMRSWTSSTIYLGSFIFASTLSMGMFAALYGEATKRIGATQYCIDLALRVFSSAMSIIVGVLWFTLSVLGDLDKFFH